jgi:hypothetical protein
MRELPETRRLQRWLAALAVFGMTGAFVWDLSHGAALRTLLRGATAAAIVMILAWHVWQPRKID